MDVFGDNRFVRSVATSNELVYFATGSGILRYNKGRDGWETPMSIPRLFEWADVVQIEATPFGELFARTSTGWFAYDSFTDVWFAGAQLSKDRNYQRIPTPGFLQGPRGTIMLDAGRFLDVAGRTISINDVVDDYSGTYWIGTNGAGPARTRISSGVIEPLTVGLAQQRTDVLFPFGDSIWCGGLQTVVRGGLTAISSSLTSFTHLITGASNGLPRLDIQSLIVSNDTLFCGTEHGVQVVIPELEQIVQTISRGYGLPSDRVTALARSGDSFYVGTDYGLALLWHDRDSARLIRPSVLGNALVYDLKVVDGRLWIATDRGCYRWRDDTDVLQTFVDSSQLLFSRVFQMSVTNDRIWFVAPSGIAWIDRTSGQQGIFRESDLRRRYRPIAASERYVATTTERGLTVIAYRGKRQDAREILLEDGLPSAQVIALSFVDDYLWIGTDLGVARLDCNELGLRE